jgi:hypothetical protein
MGIRKLTDAEREQVNKRQQFKFKREPAITLTKAETAEYLELFKTHNPGVSNLTETEFLKWVETLKRSAKSTTPITNVEKQMDERVEKKSSMFGNLIYGDSPVPVEKSADVAEYMWQDGVLRRVDPDIILDSPKPEDATRDGASSAARFPSEHVPFAGDGHGEPISAVPKPYDVTSGGTMVPEYLPATFMPEGEGEMFSPAPFKAPSPGRNPADGEEPVNFRTNDTPGVFDTGGSKRFGDGYVLKSEF